MVRLGRAAEDRRSLSIRQWLDSPPNLFSSPLLVTGHHSDPATAEAARLERAMSLPSRCASLLVAVIKPGEKPLKDGGALWTHGLRDSTAQQGRKVCQEECQAACQAMSDTSKQRGASKRSDVENLEVCLPTCNSHLQVPQSSRIAYHLKIECANI